MAQPQNSYARKARQQIAEARRVHAENPDLLRDMSQDISSDEIRHDAEKRKAAREAAFDALQVGDSLEPFGLCATVAKKNRKSVVTTMGTRWTREELC